MDDNKVFIVVQNHRAQLNFNHKKVMETSSKPRPAKGQPPGFYNAKTKRSSLPSVC